MNPNKALWEKGDFTRLARTMRGSGESFVRSLGVGPGMRVLDLGCGDGTTAIPEAELGAYYGPTMNAFDAAAKADRAGALQAELEALFASQNRSGSDQRTSVQATFLKVMVAVP